MELNDVITGITSQDGFIYTSTIGGSISAYDIANRVQASSFTLTVPDQPVAMSCTAFDLKDEMIVAGSHNGNASMWNRTTHKPIAVWADHTEKITNVQFAAESTIYTTSHDGYFRVRDLAHDYLAHSLMITRSPINALAQTSASTLAFGDYDGHVRVVDLRAKSVTMTIMADGDIISPIHTLLSATAPPLKKGKGTAESPGDARQLLYVAHGNGNVIAWDLRFPKVFCDRFHNTEEAVTTLALSGGKLYSGGDDGTVMVSHATEGTHEDVLGGFSGWVGALHAGEGAVFAGDMTGQVRIYDPNEIASNIVRRNAEREAREEMEKENQARLRELAKKMKRKKGASKSGKSTAEKYQKRV